MNITELKKEIYQTNKDNGFWDENERNIGELLMLCVSELAEALEADREDRYASLNLFEENKDKTKSCHQYIKDDTPEQAYKSAFKSHVKDSFEDEIADTIIRLLDLCEGLDIPIEKHIRYKLDYNKTRNKKHGKKY